MVKKLCLALVILAGAVPWLGAAPQSAARGAAGAKAIEEVRKVERAWLDAHEKNDAAAMDAIVADDFLITFHDGSSQTKPDLMRMVRQPQAGASAKFHTQDVRGRAYGNTVILTGRIIGEYASGEKTRRDEFLYTDTYVRQNGRWRVVASHLSRPPQAK